MAALSAYMTQRVLNTFLRGESVTPPSAWYFALYNTEPGIHNTGTEVSGLGYARKAMPAMSAASVVGGKMTISNTGSLAMDTATGNWTTANYWAILDAQTGGNLLVYAPLQVSLSVVNGQTPTFNAGDCVITLE